MEELRNLYEAYQDSILEAASKMGLLDGMFGLGKKLEDDASHRIFLKELKAYLARLEQTGTPEQIGQALQYIYRNPESSEAVLPSVYWMMIAAHGQTLQLIPRLTKADAARLLEAYQKRYIRREQMPVQRQAIKLLKAQSK